jgi:predicted ATPase/class 3 adenylate cyclase
MVCQKCGFDNPPSSAFCSRCGISTLRNQPHKAEDGTISRAERRQLTVMFCDLVGSTALSGQIDPEEFNDITREYQSVCAKVVNRHAGSIAQFLGDGLLVYFGYPVSNEDDAVRAVRAGLEIVAAVEAERERFGKALQVRVGAHTGLAVVGQLFGETNPDPMAISGETPNIAARLQNIAEPGQVVISAATHRLVRGFFVCRSLGVPVLRGVVAPIEAFDVVEPTGIHSRFEKAVASGLTTLVGRESELELLLRRLQDSASGRGQVVMLSGEPGIGKSRLLRVLKERTGGEWLSEFECRCSPYFQNSAFYPAIEFLQNGLQFRLEDDGERKFELLEKKLEQWGFSLPDSVPLYATLLSLPPNERYPALPMTPQRQKQKTMEAIVAFLLRAAELRPTRLIFEDLHWSDPSTLELLELIIEQVPRARLFVALAFRPEFDPPWRTQPHITTITLGRLARGDVEQMVRSVGGGKPLPDEVVNEIATKTEGVPLFVEELTRMVLESGLLIEQDGFYQLTSPLPELAIPSTLYDSLMTRLDRLGTAKEVAQLAATIGREFSYELLREISPLEETRLSGALNRLVDAEVVESYSSPPQLGYRFRHALIRDAAYDSLLRSQRRQYHRRLAEVLQQLSTEDVEQRPELLANHLSEAGQIKESIPRWEQAGRKAMERSANREAIQHLTKALEMLKRLPPDPMRDQQEFALQITLGVPLMLIKGFAAPEVEQLYSRARNLYQQIPESPQLFPMLFGLWAFYSVRADYLTARNLGQELLVLAQSTHDPALLLEAHTACGNTLSFLGELVTARQHLEEAISLYDPRQHGSHAYIYAQDPGVHSLSYATLTLWLMGYPQQARKRSLEALTLGRELCHPFSLAFAMIHVLYIHRFSADLKLTQELADELLKLATEYEFPIPLAVGAAHHGWALVGQGRREEGVREIRQGIESWRATGSTLFFQPFLLGMLAEALEKAGLPEEGLTSVAEALSIANATGERFWEAELYRLKGELTLQREVQASQFTDPIEAEECFRMAINTAKRQAAKSLELRATMSLSRLWLRQGKRAEAHQTLAEIYGWFTEGFDDGDLKDVNALLSHSF